MVRHPYRYTPTQQAMGYVIYILLWFVLHMHWKGSIYTNFFTSQIPKLYMFSICLYRVCKKTLLKSICPTGSFTCPGPAGNGISEALIWFMICCVSVCTWFTVCMDLLWMCTGLFDPYHWELLHWHWGNHMIAPVPVKQPSRIWVNTNHMNPSRTVDITAPKQCAKSSASFVRKIVI